MNRNEAESYPLFKDFEFGLHITCEGGSGTLLIPHNNGEDYIPKEYGFGELALAPYLQVPFNHGCSIVLGDLVDELKEEKQFSLYRMPLPGESWFLQNVINRFTKHNIINFKEKRFLDKHKLSKLDVLEKGQKYDLTRVFKMQPTQRSPFGDFE